MRHPAGNRPGQRVIGGGATRRPMGRPDDVALAQARRRTCSGLGRCLVGVGDGVLVGVEGLVLVAAPVGGVAQSQDDRADHRAGARAGEHSALNVLRGAALAAAATRRGRRRASRAGSGCACSRAWCDRRVQNRAQRPDELTPRHALTVQRRRPARGQGVYPPPAPSGVRPGPADQARVLQPPQRGVEGAASRTTASLVCARSRSMTAYPCSGPPSRTARNRPFRCPRTSGRTGPPLCT